MRSESITHSTSYKYTHFYLILKIRKKRKFHMSFPRDEIKYAVQTCLLNCLFISFWLTPWRSSLLSVFKLLLWVDRSWQPPHQSTISSLFLKSFHNLHLLPLQPYPLTLHQTTIAHFLIYCAFPTLFRGPGMSFVINPTWWPFSLCMVTFTHPSRLCSGGTICGKPSTKRIWYYFCKLLLCKIPNNI